METNANIRKLLRRAIRKLPAYVVELRGQPQVDRDGNELVVVDVVLVSDAAFAKLLEEHRTEPIDRRMRETFWRAKVQDWVHLRFCPASDIAEIVRDEDRDLPPHLRAVRVRRQRRVRAKKAGAARRPRLRATKRKAG